MSEAVLWEYLKNNLYKLGISYDALKLNYSNKTRGGCWFCANRKVTAADSLENEIVLRMRSYLPPSDYVRALDKYGEVNTAAGISYRTHLRYCKQWYNEVTELQKKWGRELMTETSKKFIKEIWNYRETRNNRIMQKDFLADVKSGQYKMIYPELFDIVFYKKGNRYCYIPGIIKKVR